MKFHYADVAEAMERAADEMERLRAVNAELKAVLEALIVAHKAAISELDPYGDSDGDRNIIEARAAIEKAKGDQ